MTDFVGQAKKLAARARQVSTVYVAVVGEETNRAARFALHVPHDKHRHGSPIAEKRPSRGASNPLPEPRSSLSE